MKTKRNKKRELWLAAFQANVTGLAPEFSGRIDWDAAIFHFNQGRTPEDAAIRFIKSEQPTQNNR